MRILLNQATLPLLLVLATVTPLVKSHGYASSPRSRNWVAHQDGKYLNSGTGTEKDPLKEDCFHCLNRGDTAAGQVCGISGDGFHDYMEPRNALGGYLAPNVQATYTEGSIIEIESVLTSHHMGHQVVKACPDFFNPTQECFDAHPLEFIEDVYYGAPKDLNFPERGYFAPNDGSAEGPGSQELPLSWGMEFKMKFKLPDGVHGDLVLLQWNYVTGNSCRHNGYDQYPWPTGWEPDNMPACPDPLPTNGADVPPEQFWNCIEVSIQRANTMPTPAPTPDSDNTVPTPTPTPDSDNIFDEGCCSHTFKLCDGWCGQTSKSECNSCGNGALVWIDPPSDSCIERWGTGCNSNSDCCSPGYCADNKQCMYNPIANPQPSPTPPPITSPPAKTPSKAPTPPTGCFSNNYKDCLPANYVTGDESCNKIWLPNGNQSNCLALWEECSGQQNSCCEPAMCFGDATYAFCVPP